VHKVDSSHTPTRRCLASGDTKPQGELVRFILGPDQQVVPDIAGKLPGRGLWVSASRDAVELACEKGLFARAARANAKADADLPDLVDQLLRQACLNCLGLARKSGDLVNGFEKVKAWLKSGRATVLLCAADASADGREKLQRLAGEIPVFELFSSAELSQALGQQNVVHVALKDGGLARRLVQQAQRLAGYGLPTSVPGQSQA